MVIIRCFAFFKIGSKSNLIEHPVSQFWSSWTLWKRVNWALVDSNGALGINNAFAVKLKFTQNPWNSFLVQIIVLGNYFKALWIWTYITTLRCTGLLKNSESSAVCHLTRMSFCALCTYIIHLYDWLLSACAPSLRIYIAGAQPPKSVHICERFRECIIYEANKENVWNCRAILIVRTRMSCCGGSWYFLFELLDGLCPFEWFKDHVCLVHFFKIYVKSVFVFQCPAYASVFSCNIKWYFFFSKLNDMIPKF